MDDLEEVFEALTTLAGADPGALEEALASFELDDPEGFEKLERALKTDPGWRG